MPLPITIKRKSQDEFFFVGCCQAKRPRDPPVDGRNRTLLFFVCVPSCSRTSCTGAELGQSLFSLRKRTRPPPPRFCCFFVPAPQGIEGGKRGRNANSISEYCCGLSHSSCPEKNEMDNKKLDLKLRLVDSASRLCSPTPSLRRVSPRAPHPVPSSVPSAETRCERRRVQSKGGRDTSQ